MAKIEEETKVRKGRKKIELTDEVVDDDKELEEIKKQEPKKKSQRELRTELRHKKNELEVEILNMNSGGTVCRDRNGRIVFELENYGDREFIMLADLYDVASRHKGFFEKHLISIIDVDSDEYGIEEIIEYLGLNEIYDEIENYDTDYIGHILKLDTKKFTKFIEHSSEDLARITAERAMELFKKGKFDSRLKEKVLVEKLGREDLFEI